MYPAKKPLRFVKIVVFLRAVSSEILSEISPFALFFVKKQLKKHDVPKGVWLFFFRGGTLPRPTYLLNCQILAFFFPRAEKKAKKSKYLEIFLLTCFCEIF